MAMAEEKRVTDLDSTHRDDLVTVEIGSQHKSYLIHKALLIEHSEYFSEVLDNSWTEMEKKVIRLEDIECSDFERFVNWLYTQSIPGKGEDWLDGGFDENDEHANSLCSGCADYFFDKGFHAYERTIIFAYANLPVGNPILRMLVNAQHAYFDFGSQDAEFGYNQSRENVPGDFLLAMKKQHAKVKDGKVSGLPQCGYDKHTSEGGTAFFYRGMSSTGVEGANTGSECSPEA